MGLFDRFRSGGDEVAVTRSALEAAQDAEADDSAVSRLVQMLLDVGIDGKGPFDSAAEVAAEALREEGSVEAAVTKVARKHLLGGAAGGFVTGLGGFVTMPVAMPVNVFEFYAQATRMVAAIASLRGYDLAQPEVRTAVGLTLVGSNADDVLKKAGMTVGGGRLASLAFKQLPPTAILIINKALGFRLLRGLGVKSLSRLGRGLPVAGGVVGAGVDGYMMNKIADQARREFPARG